MLTWPRTVLLLGLASLPAGGPTAAGPPRPGPATDALPAGAVARLGSVGLRHASTVEVLAFAPDGKTLASLGQDAVIRLWDTATGGERAQLSLPKGKRMVQQMAFSPDGKVLAFTGLDQAIHLRDAATGKPLHALKWPSRKGTSPLFAFTADGKKLASWDNTFTVRIWDVGSGRQLSSFAPVPSRAVTRMAFAPDGTTLATVSDDRSARLWDTATGKERQRFEGPKYGFYSLAVSPDGETLATGCMNEVRLWETATGKERARMGDYRRPVLALAFAPDGARLTAASDDGDCRVWRVRDGKELQRVRVVQEEGVANPVSKMALSADGATLAWVGWKSHNQVHLTDVKTGKERLSGGGQPSGALAAFAPDGKTVAAPCEDGRLRLWESATGKELRVFAGEPGKVLWLGFSPDGKAVIALGREVVFWDPATGKEIRRHPAPKGTFTGRTCALSPGGKELALGEVTYSRPPPGRVTNCRVLLWDLEAAKEKRAFQGTHQGSVMSVVFSPDGKQVASVGRDDTVRLWDAVTGKELHRWETMQGHGQAVAFAGGGKGLLAFSAYFGEMSKETFRVVQWELATGKERSRFEGTAPGVVNSVPLFCPAGRVLACVHMPGGIDVWETGAGKASRELRTGQQALAMPIAFSADGRLLASWHGDSTILLWDVGGRR